MRSVTLSFVVLFWLLAGCGGDISPKPKAYPRIALPEPDYLQPADSSWNCPYIFEASRYSYLTVDPRYREEPCWINIYYPRYKATIHLTYFPLQDDLAFHIEETRKLAMKHISKATQINETLVENPQARVYGLVYDFRGETASDMQFFLTDSVHHFVRGALYFNMRPNKDSLAPVIAYIKNDLDHFITSFRWTDR
ncbi:MAG: gliding motility lipoprotein GldD [Salibacteraceae bacterium]